jgi:CheY-like chemotaxis protein
MKEKVGCILLVDDDEGVNFLNKMIIDECLTAKKVQVALNGKEALHFLKEKVDYTKCLKPLLIFLDINMPVMDGWEFLDEYSQLEKHIKKHTAIVMLTTSFNPDDKKAAQKSNYVTAFKNKPLTEEALKEIVTQHFVEPI